MKRIVVFDLDDTLFKEICYLKSAYREIVSWAVRRCKEYKIPEYVLKERAYEIMLDSYYRGGNAFESLNAYLGINVQMDDFLRIYRNHIPNIKLEDDVRMTLDRLKAENVIMGILSDGREITQWNKIRILGLTEWINEDLIVINSSVECFKPNPCGYQRLESIARTLYSDEELSFTYVGDNVNKDFISPKKMGWCTVCLKDDGRNIHSQKLSDVVVSDLPERFVESICEIC